MISDVDTINIVLHKYMHGFELLNEVDFVAFAFAISCRRVSCARTRQHVITYLAIRRYGQVLEHLMAVVRR